MEDSDLVLVNMVEENREVFSHREISGAREARRLLEMFDYPSQKTFEHMVRTRKHFLSLSRTFATLTLFNDAIFPPSKGKQSANNQSASNQNT